MPVLRPDQGTGYTSIDQYLDANQGTLAREGSDIAQDIGSRIDQAHGAADQVIAADKANYTPDYTTLPGYQDALDKAIAAKTDTAALGSEGGVADYFHNKYHETLGDGGTAPFDAQLLGASGRLDTAGLQGRAGGLIDYLNQGLAAVQPPAPAERAPPEFEDVDRNTGSGADQAGRMPAQRPPGQGYPPSIAPTRRPRTPGPGREV